MLAGITTDTGNTVGSETGRFVIARIAGSRYALPVDRVREVHQAAAVTPAPAGSEPVAGWIDLRGAVVPMLDGRLVLGLAAVPWDTGMHFVVVSSGDAVAALMVDTVDGVEEALLAQDASSEAPARPGIVAGVVKSDDGLVVLLDVRRVVASAAYREPPAPVEASS